MLFCFSFCYPWFFRVSKAAEIVYSPNTIWGRKKTFLRLYLVILNAMSGRFYHGLIKLAKMLEIGTCTTSAAGWMIILQASLT